MSILHRFGALVLAFVPLFAGCVAGEPVEDLDEPPARPMDKNGSTGTNGLDSPEYFFNELHLVKAAASPLADPGSTEVTAAVQSTLLSTPSGVEVFEYAVRCALPEDVTVTWGDTKMNGLGHLLSTEHWLQSPLSEEATLSLLACMVAHVNPFGQHVPLLLTGPDVSFDGLDHDDFDVDEALWVARRNAAGGIEYVVWPSEVLQKECGPDPMSALMQRVCGQSPGACHILQGDPSDCVVDAESGGYFCLGQPALETTLRSKDLKVLYPGCF